MRLISNAAGTSPRRARYWLFWMEVATMYDGFVELSVLAIALLFVLLLTIVL
ncbi:hypothetical protein J2Y48_002315 [Mycoplana sp. BE70]|uniref:hypothetical protein n=1 Tax=Mycoplana sp. BE70 TaxID=2817775 RepID=UPI0028632517|nr:hypothetical protein [Mycoplana sp. BE70]MDR6757019.1 hypothetical protein [Mycoplana sp. BE70]